VGKEPIGIAVQGRSVWVVNSGSNSVTRIDARSERVVGRAIPVGADPTDVAVGADTVWVTNTGDGTVSRIRTP